MVTRGMRVRSFGFMLFRRASRHGALRSVRLSALSSSPPVSAASDCIARHPASACGRTCSCRCSVMCSISVCSSRLKVLMRLNISSQSTSAPSNSGPSMHTNFVLPPIVRRQAPHIPVPSTMMVLRETSVGMPYFCVVRQANFIIIAGPMANALSIFSCCMNFSMPTVTTPFSPRVPSSVMTITSSECRRISSSRMTRSAERPAMTESTLLPAAFSAFTMGRSGAVPTPPDAQRTVP